MYACIQMDTELIITSLTLKQNPISIQNEHGKILMEDYKSNYNNRYLINKSKINK